MTDTYSLATLEPGHLSDVRVEVSAYCTYLDTVRGHFEPTPGAEILALARHLHRAVRFVGRDPVRGMPAIMACAFDPLLEIEDASELEQAFQEAIFSLGKAGIQ